MTPLAKSPAFAGRQFTYFFLLLGELRHITPSGLHDITPQGELRHTFLQNSTSAEPRRRRKGRQRLGVAVHHSCLTPLFAHAPPCLGLLHRPLCSGDGHANLLVRCCCICFILLVARSAPTTCCSRSSKLHTPAAAAAAAAALRGPLLYCCGPADVPLVYMSKIAGGCC